MLPKICEVMRIFQNKKIKKVGVLQKCVDLVDLVKSFQTKIYLQKIGVDTAENEPLEVWGKIQFIIHSPP